MWDELLACNQFCLRQNGRQADHTQCSCAAELRHMHVRSAGQPAAAMAVMVGQRCGQAPGQ